MPQLHKKLSRCASSSMRFLIIVTFLLFGTRSFSQNNELIRLAFSDKSNFDITTRLDNKRPLVYYVMRNTDKWNTYRFHLNEDLTSEAVRRRLENDEHSYYNHTYIFKDTLLDKLFDSSEKRHLFEKAQSLRQRKLADTFQTFKLINSFRTARNGFFFSVTDPVFTTNKQYAFIDIITFRKDQETGELNDAYYGTTLLIYKNSKGKDWTRIRKLDRLIL